MVNDDWWCSITILVSWQITSYLTELVFIGEDTSRPRIGPRAQMVPAWIVTINKIIIHKYTIIKLHEACSNYLPLPLTTTRKIARCHLLSVDSWVPSKVYGWLAHTAHYHNHWNQWLPINHHAYNRCPMANNHCQRSWIQWLIIKYNPFWLCQCQSYPITNRGYHLLGSNPIISG